MKQQTGRNRRVLIVLAMAALSFQFGSAGRASARLRAATECGGDTRSVVTMTHDEAHRAANNSAARGASVTAANSAPYACEGAACPSVTVVWEDEGQRFRADNTSDRPVKVEVTTLVGVSVTRVEPRKSAYLQVTYFNGPYRASYE